MFNLMAYSSRGNFLMLTVGITILYLFFKPKVKNIKKTRSKKFTTIFIFVSFLIFSMFLMELILPNSLNFIMWKVTSTLQSEQDSGISSSGVRLYELINIYGYLISTGNYIWGVGLGGYFRDTYMPFAYTLYGASAFPDEWIAAGTLYKPHGTPLFLMLKFGFGGVIIYYISLIRFMYVTTKYTNRINIEVIYRYIIYGIVAFLPLLFYKNFTSKLQVTMGILMSLVVSYLSVTKELSGKDIALNK